MADTDKTKPLRKNVRMLGNLLGEVIAEQEGKGTLDLEERIRQLAKRMRQRPSRATERRLRGLIGSLSPESMQRVLRAFAVYFQLVNIAEQHHRIQRLKSYQFKSPHRTATGSLEHTIRLLSKTATRAAFSEFVHRLHITPVVTAHPTEAMRRTVLEKHSRIWQLLEKIDERVLTPAELGLLRLEIKRYITSLWQTEETRSFELTVLDELYNALYYIRTVLYEAVPEFYREFEGCARKYFHDWAEPIPTFLRFGSWIGGDRDGHPHVTADVTWRALLVQSTTILNLYLGSVEELFSRHSESVKLVGASDELVASLERDRSALDSIDDVIRVRGTHEVYRMKLSAVYARLKHRRDSIRGQGVDGPHYRNAEEFLSDLRIIDRSLRAHKGEILADGLLKDLIRTVETFGFHCVTLDVRQHRMIHRGAIADLLQRSGVSYESMSDDERAAWLSDQLEKRAHLTYDDLRQSAATHEVVETFRTILRAQNEIYPLAIRTYIVSMTSCPADILEILFLMKHAGLLTAGSGGWESRLDVVPLFETIDDLHAAPRIMRQLYTNPVYRAHLTARGNRQEIMVGYSDSGKDGGIVRSHVELFEAQRTLVKVSSEFRIACSFFHGRGGTVGRGGGPEYEAILALPRDTVTGVIRITEQGEVISLKYAHRAIARRSMELTTSAMLLAGVSRHAGSASRQRQEAKWEAAFETIGEFAHRKYRETVYEQDGFASYFLQATPIRHITRMQIGSRPSRRVESQRIEDLRAIPWAFGWMQTRHVLPGWFGVGSSIAAFISTGARKPSGIDRTRLARLHDMYMHWAPFRALIDNIQMTIAKADFDIARSYADLVVPRELGQRVYSGLREEFELSRRMVLLVTKQRNILDNNQTLQRSIELRNPYVDPMSYIQVELLRRLSTAQLTDEDRHDLEEAVFLSINGIAAGLRNTG